MMKAPAILEIAGRLADYLDRPVSHKAENRLFKTWRARLTQ